MGSINYLQAIRPDTAYLKKIIETSLLSDWAIRIEYHSGDSEAASWQVWDQALFAIRSADEVLAAILDCYTKHPRDTIRLNAEKFRPQSKLLLTVYDPQLMPAETDSGTKAATRRYPRERDQPPLQVGLRTLS